MARKEGARHSVMEKGKELASLVTITLSLPLNSIPLTPAEWALESG